MKLTRDEIYQAMLDRAQDYMGMVFIAVKTTGVFCRVGCPARTPKLENCVFYETADEALAAGFRPCKRCRPLEYPGRVSEIVQQLVDAVEADPERKWRTEDLRAYFADASTVRRQFKKRFGMTFVAYARVRRMDVAVRHIQNGASVIDAQIASGYESGSGFRDAFSRIVGAAPARIGDNCVLKVSWLDTKLGPMIAIADDRELYLLEFADRRGLEREVERLQQRKGAAIIPGSTAPIEQLQSELRLYFDGALTEFKTPAALVGSAFQTAVWEALRSIPAGETRSYSELAAAVGRPTAVRAVARANGANPLALIVPCHRVIGASGELTGYGGGLNRKAWLLSHERAAAGGQG